MSKATRRAFPILLTVSWLFLGCAPEDPVLEARKLMSAGDYEGSVAALQALLDERPDDPELNYLYGVTVSSQGQPTLATWALLKAMEHPDWLVRAGMAFASGSLQTQQHDAALDAMNRVLEQEPENIEALLLRARVNYESRRGYEESLADAERVLELDPDSRDGVIWKAVNLLQLERVDEAEEIINSVEQLYAEADAPLNQTLFFCAGRAAFAAAKGEMEVADERFQECLALDPTHPAVIEEAVKFYEATGDRDRILEIFEAAHEADDGTKGFRSALAGAYLERGRREAAEALLLEGTESENAFQAINSWMDLAEMYTRREAYGEAASAVKQAIDRVRESGRRVEPLLLFNYADMLLLSERYDEARAAIADSTVPHFKTYIEGRALLEEGQPEAALEQLNATLALWPNNAASRYYAALASEAVGDFNGAIEGYRYAIRAGPDATDARLRLGQLHAAAGDYERANTALAAGMAQTALANDLRLEGLRIVGLTLSGDDIRRRLRALRGKPIAIPGLVHVARGLHERAGAEAALSLIESTGPDLTRPAYASVLRDVVGYLGELDRHDEAVDRAAAAVAAREDFAPVHEAHGRALLGAGSPDAKAAFERANELLPENARVLEGLGQVAAREGDVEGALAYFGRAAAADDLWEVPSRSAAELLIEKGRSQEAEAHLAELVERDPYDPWAPSQLATLLLDRGAQQGRALALAKRAAYCGGGEDAAALLARAQQAAG